MSNIKPDGNKEIFLATTALEEFWDTTKPIVFLGEWCLVYNRRSFWEPLKGKCLGSPFCNDEAADVACHYVNEVYERILPILGDALNTVHGTRHSLRYWRIIIGPWLLYYLPVIYDRFNHLKRAFEQYPACTTIVLQKDSFVTPSDTMDFALYLQEDSFNLQIYTKILAAMGKAFPSKVTHIANHSLARSFISISWKHKVIGFFTKIYADVSERVFQPVILRKSYFSKASEFDLVIKTAGKVLPIWGELTKPTEAKFDSDIRKQLSNIWLGDGEFEKCLSKMLSSDMPSCFVEGHVKANSDLKITYPKTPKAIFSAGAWYFDEAFKQWAAASAEEGTFLIGTPHGGDYGSWANMAIENHETSIVDRFYSWGWERTDCAAEVIPFPATKLVRRKKLGASNQKVGILWAATTYRRYLFQFPVLPKDVPEYLEWQHRFASALSINVLCALRFRPHREDNGWGVVQRLKECIPDLNIETWNVPFQKSLANCRLYVCDHMSTTYTEALAANKPTILFWNPKIIRLRPEAQPYHDLLRQNGILFDTPESAALAVSQVYDNVEAWWNDPERQNAVDIFCKRFARNSPDALELWAAEFKKIAAMAKTEL